MTPVDIYPLGRNLLQEAVSLILLLLSLVNPTGTTRDWYPPPPSHPVEIKQPPNPYLNMAKRVSYCESGNKNAENPDSSASGYFQFVSNTWIGTTGLPPPASLYPYDVQLEAFYKLWDEGRGASHWEPSRVCWEHEDPWNHYDR